MIKFSNYSKRKIVVLSLVLVLFLSGGSFAINKIFFKADEVKFSPYNIIGKTYELDTKKPLAKTTVTLSADKKDKYLGQEMKDMLAPTNASGDYSIAPSSMAYNHILVHKDGYCDLEGVITNFSGQKAFFANFGLKKGSNCTESVQIINLNYDKNVKGPTATSFGVALNLTDSSLATLKLAIFNLANYSEELLIKDTNYLTTYDPIKAKTLTYSSTKKEVTTLQRGTIYTFNNYGPYPKTLILRGVKDNNAYSAKNLPATASSFKTDAFNKAIKITNPFLVNITYADIKVKYQNREYSLYEAVQNKILMDNIELQNDGDYPSKITDKILTKFKAGNLTSIFRTGEIVSIHPNKPIEITISLPGASKNTSLIEVPAGISLQDVRDITARKKAAKPEDQKILDEKKSALLAQMIPEMAKQQKSKELKGLPLDAYFTINGDPISTSPMNPYYLNKLGTSGKTVSLAETEKASAAEPTMAFSVNKESFGSDAASYDRLNKFMTDNTDNIKLILGEPYFSRNIEIYNNNPDVLCKESKFSALATLQACKEGLSNLKDNAFFEGPLNVIVVDKDSPIIANNLEGVLLHEISHSWRSVVSNSYDTNLEEGMAHAFLYIFCQVFDRNYYNNIDSGPVENFDYWSKDIMNYFTVDNDRDSPEPFVASRLSMFEVSQDIATPPKTLQFWTRQMYGTAFLKIYQEWEDPGFTDVTFFKPFQENLFNVIVNDCGDACKKINKTDPYSAQLIDIFQKHKITTSRFLDALSMPIGDNSSSIEKTSVKQWFNEKTSLLMKKRLYGDVPDYLVALNYLPVAKSTFCNLPDSDLMCKFEDKSTLFFYKKVSPSGQYLNWGVAAVKDTKMFLNFHFGNSFSRVKAVTDGDGILNFEDYLQSVRKILYTGAVHLVTVNSEGDHRIVSSQNLFMSEGKSKSDGVYGTTDASTDGDEIVLTLIKGGDGNYSDHSDDPVKNIVFKSKINKNIFKFPEAKNYNGTFKIEIPSSNYSKEFTKWKGNYNLDIKTDSAKPEISNIVSQINGVVKFSLNEPASTFIEYGDTVGNYSNVSFGVMADSSRAQGDIVRAGERAITLDALGKGKEYHYRVWAIDFSGNISTSGDNIIDTYFTFIGDAQYCGGTAKIGFEAAIPVKSIISYATSRNNSKRQDFSTPNTKQAVDISGLVDGEIVSYQINLYGDNVKGSQRSGNRSFTYITCKPLF